MKPIVNSEHVATKFLNHSFLNGLKFLLKNPQNIYERLHEEHLRLKEERGNFSYLHTDDILNFILKDNPKVYEELKPEARNQIEIVSLHCAASLNWKQFKQIYRFQPQLLEELWDIDFTEDKYEVLTMEELQYLPCYSFFVEFPLTLNNINYNGVVVGNVEYKGFIFYFDYNKKIPEMLTPTVLLVSDQQFMTYGGYKTPYFDCYRINLCYNFDSLTIVSKDTGETFTAEMNAQAVLNYLNPVLFQEIGEEKALELIIKINQIITYLACSNCDMNRIQKPKRKPDIKRTHITDMEYEVWRLGDSYYKLPNGKEINTRYLNTEEHAYAKHEIPEESDNPREPSEYIKDRRKGYHVRPHMRKAHWASFWYGKRDGSEERIKRRKFVSAVFINNTGDEIEIPTREIIKYRF